MTNLLMKDLNVYRPHGYNNMSEAQRATVRDAYKAGWLARDAITDSEAIQLLEKRIAELDIQLDIAAGVINTLRTTP